MTQVPLRPRMTGVHISWSPFHSNHWHQPNHCTCYKAYRDMFPRDQDTILAEKGCLEMLDFRMAALMFLTGHGIKARTHTHAEIAHFPTRCIIRTRKAPNLRRLASPTLMMHLIGKCASNAFKTNCSLCRCRSKLYLMFQHVMS